MKIRKLLAVFLSAVLAVTTVMVTGITASATLARTDVVEARLSISGTADYLAACPVGDVLDNLYSISGTKIEVGAGDKVALVRTSSVNVIADFTEDGEHMYTYDLADKDIDLVSRYDTVNVRNFRDLYLLIGQGTQLGKNTLYQIDVTSRGIYSLSVDTSFYMQKNSVRNKVAEGSAFFSDYSSQSYKDSTGVISTVPYGSIYEYCDELMNAGDDVFLCSTAVLKDSAGRSVDNAEIKAFKTSYSKDNRYYTAETEITNEIFAGDPDAAGSGYTVKSSANNLNSQVVYECYVDGVKVYSGFVYHTLKGRAVKIAFKPSVYDGATLASLDNYYSEYPTESNYGNVIRLKPGYSLGKAYSLKLEFRDPGMIVKAVEGFYSSYDAAEALPDIKDALMTGTYGYTLASSYQSANTITLFVKDDLGNYRYLGISYYGIVEDEQYDEDDDGIVLNDDISVPIVDMHDPWFNVKGVKDFSTKAIDHKYDSYYGYGYQTLFLDPQVTVDMSSLLLNVSSAAGDRAYLSKSGDLVGVKASFDDTPQDFSVSPVQYTISTGQKTKNYNVSILKQQSGAKLYVNGPSERNAIGLDSYFGFEHNILIANIGDQPLTGLTVTLSDAENVQLDDYWTVGGYNNSTLNAFTHESFEDNTYLAKIQLLPTATVTGDGAVKGTLTISADGQEPVTVKLSGHAGNPHIVTESPLKDAVKFVPYSKIIATDNIYSWNTISFSYSGTLPSGVTFNEKTGEIYGVPQETGDFSFTVTGSSNIKKLTGLAFEDTTAEFEFTVKENTDENVYNETDSDSGYALLTPLGNEVNPGQHNFLISDISTDQLLVSEGVFGDFIDLWLNGKKLVSGTDYDAESGSTKITIKTLTLRTLPEQATNTIAVEFRVDGNVNNDLRRTAQNFVLDLNSSSGSEEPGSGSESGSGGGHKPDSGEGSGSGHKPDSGEGSGSGSGESGSGSGGSGDVQPGGTTGGSVSGDNTPAVTTTSTTTNTEKTTTTTTTTTTRTEENEPEIIGDDDDDTDDDTTYLVDSDEDEYFDEDESDDDTYDPDDDAADKVDFVGYVRGTDGTKLSGLKVELHSAVRTSATDKNGVFSFEDTETGTHKLILTDITGNTTQKTFSLEYGDNVFVGQDKIVSDGDLVNVGIVFDGKTITFCNVSDLPAAEAASGTPEATSVTTGVNSGETNPHTSVAANAIPVILSVSLLTAAGFASRKKRK